MNRRIQELITQAGGYWNHGDFGLGSSVEFQENDIKLFVELLLKDVINIVQPDPYEGDAMTASLNAKVHQLKQHFGAK